MIVIGELNLTFKIEGHNFPYVSEEIMQMKDGGTRKVELIFTEMDTYVMVKATLNDSDKSDMLSSITCYKQEDGSDFSHSRTGRWCEHDKSLTSTWAIHKVDKDIKLYIQILSEKSLYAKQEAEKKMQSNMASALFKDHAAVRRNGLMADVTIVADGVRYPSHKAILSARSEVFAAMFTHEDTLESQQKEVVIKDIDKQTMEMFLTFIYDVTLPTDLSFEGYAELLGTADKYQVPSLVDYCVMKMRQNMSADNAVQGAIFGSVYRSKELKEDAIKVIVNAETTLSSMNGYKELRAYPDLLIEIVDYTHGDRQESKSKKRKRSLRSV